ncbi:Uncharacterised protein [Serratia fonticola]|uniref:Uncharacterized protein n=1 Tax=Serratia fonticola TaxID=47917 RepID=A0A4V6KQZ2_SERFO|nr:Uncharacterised protein [Serratia fonticola]
MPLLLFNLNYASRMLRPNMFIPNKSPTLTPLLFPSESC